MVRQLERAAAPRRAQEGRCMVAQRSDYSKTSKESVQNCYRE